MTTEPKPVDEQQPLVRCTLPIEQRNEINLSDLRGPDELARARRRIECGAGQLASRMWLRPDFTFKSGDQY